MKPLQGKVFAITGALPVGPIQRTILERRVTALGGTVKPISLPKKPQSSINLTHILLVDCDETLNEESIKKKFVYLKRFSN